MVPPLWKLLLAAHLSSGRESVTGLRTGVEDQASLFQSHLSSHKSAYGSTVEDTQHMNFPKMSSLTDPSQRKMALAQFEETAIELASNRATVTPVVVEVCNTTADLLRDMVMPAIIREHDTDVQMLAATYAEFHTIEQQRLEYKQLIESALDSVYGPGGLVEVHTECRIQESAECVRCSSCEDDCEEKVTECELAEVELRERLEEVIERVSRDAYCDADGIIHPPQSETIITQTMHAVNLPAFNAYLAALAAFEECEVTRETVCTPCNHVMEESPTVATFLDMNQRRLSEPGAAVPNPSSNEICQNHTNIRVECNTYQRQLQAGACDSRHLATNYLSLYEAAFLAAVARYNNQKATVMILEADRKVEWDTLERVICLLMSLTNEEDGSASSVATAEIIEGCRNDFVDTSHLDIVYLPTPEMGSLPDLPDNPCEDEFADEIYSDLPMCMGIGEYLEKHEHGVLTDCTCSAEAPVEVHVGFPYELGPYLLFNAGFELNSAAGFEVVGVGSEWRAATGGAQYTGQISPFVAVTLPELDAAFGLSGTDSVAQVAWAYGDPRGTTDLELHGEEYPETIQHRFVRTGGYVYRNAQGLVVALKEIAPSSDSLGQNAQLTLFFGEPLEIAESLALQACAEMSPTTLGRLQDSGAEEYCWEFSGVIPGCDHGCFVFRTLTHGFLAFPVTEAPEEISSGESTSQD